MEISFRFHIIIGAFTSLSLLSCTSSSSHIIHGYASPVITGQIVDKKTNKPIKNVSLFQTSEDGTLTDQNGYFKLLAYKESYSASDNGEGLQLMSEGGFNIQKDGYKIKYYPNRSLQFLEVKYTEEVPYHIHLGKVYLEPLPKGIGIHDVEANYVEKMSFCQPNQSQKEVNCMPLPDGINNEDL